MWLKITPIYFNPKGRKIDRLYKNLKKIRLPKSNFLLKTITNGHEGVFLRQGRGGDWPTAGALGAQTGAAVLSDGVSFLLAGSRLTLLSSAGARGGSDSHRGFLNQRYLQRRKNHYYPWNLIFWEGLIHLKDGIPSYFNQTIKTYSF